MSAQPPRRRFPVLRGRKRAAEPAEDPGHEATAAPDSAPVVPEIPPTDSGGRSRRRRGRGRTERTKGVPRVHFSGVPQVKNRSGRARKGDVRRAILALLAEAPMNGYEIITALAERSAGLWRPSPGAVYPALSQLQDEGLIAESAHHGQRGFALTDAGREAARDVDQPWEAVRQRVAAATAPESAASAAYERLDAAVRAFNEAGSPDQVEAAATILEEATKAIYSLLATPDGSN
ncbi:MAG: PadR family transcriptional regulator [Propioniciclava sp.]